MDNHFGAGAQRLGLVEEDVRELVELHRAGHCAPAQRRMADLVGTRLAGVEAQLHNLLAEQAAAGGVGTADVAPMARSIPLARSAGQLQAAARILAEPAAAGGCSDGCACARAAAVTDGAWSFPTVAGAPAPDGPPVVCTLDAEGGDMAERLGDWQAVLAGATGRYETAEGIAVTFDHDLGRTAELGRLIAAEYACCSFASYHLTVDGHGVRLEVRTPPAARDALTAVFGTAGAAR